MLFGIYGYGVVLTIIPDFVGEFGIENKGIYLLYLTIASVSTRFWAGRASDVYGRLPVLIWGLVITCLAMFFTGIVQTASQLYTTSFVLGIGVGMLSPTIFAWTIDLCPEKFRGKGMATLYIALEIGIGAGALVSAAIYNNDSNMFVYAFWSCSVASLIALLYLIWYKRHLKRLATY